jgi:hypothetical protein
MAMNDPLHGGKPNARALKLGHGMQPLEGTKKLVSRALVIAMAS